MKLTKEQQARVEENLGLVYKVLGDKLGGQAAVGCHTREDLFQIGCIGLCKAVATDKGGTFSTYAYKLIWHEICDALNYANCRRVEIVQEEPYAEKPAESVDKLAELRLDMFSVIGRARQAAPPSTVRGLDAMLLMAEGYTCKEIGEKLGASDNLVTAWVSKARKFLKDRPQSAAVMEAYAA
ncbi:sigma-70 family RNA polymerase sigma factor [Acutalibacter sp. JLR.KK004]|uniref:sigma-70 family RNA polymerase sigma factor n=1 Tax=Acutalibacter sp. JLR.KK004 TaxID=3112622 RepID=UPI002FF25476